MGSYSNYIRDYNASRIHNRVFNDVIRSRMNQSSDKPIDFRTKYENSKEALAKQDYLNKLKNSYLKSWAGNTIVDSTSSSNNSSSSVSSTSSSSSNSSKSEEENTNTFNVCNGKTFDVSLSYDKKITFTSQNGQVYMTKNTGELTSADIAQIGKIEQLITSLVHDASGNYVKSNFDTKEIKEVLNKVGIEPGKFTIKSSSGSNKFYMTDNGKLYSNYEIECERNFYNNTNFKKCFGYSDDAVCIIDGKNYKIGKDGCFKIPSSVICVPENMTIKK